MTDPVVRTYMEVLEHSQLFELVHLQEHAKADTASRNTNSNHVKGETLDNVTDLAAV